MLEDSDKGLLIGLIALLTVLTTAIIFLIVILGNC